MSAALSLVSLNIERSKHLDLVVPFLKARMPDVTCLQELCERDVAIISAALGGATSNFAPMLRHIEAPGQPIVGVGIFSRLPVAQSDALYYVGSRDALPDHDPRIPGTIGRTMSSVLVLSDIEKNGTVFRIGTTHFTWSERGLPDDLQRANIPLLLSALESVGDLVFCGDLNAPRGGDIFARLAEKYKDNIPQSYVWSLDFNIHRAGRQALENNAQEAGLKGFMVDGLFSTPAYRADNVELISGVSDHCAVVAEVTRVF